MRGSEPHAPLRALDWRFLLPRPRDPQFHHLILLGGTKALAQRIVEVGLARHVSETLTVPGSADAVVVLHRSRIEPRDLARVLVPGGVLYWEIDRRRQGLGFRSPARIRGTLREAALSGLALYAVLPDFAEPRMYLPLDRAGPLRWYFSTRHSALTPSQHLLKAGLRVLTGLDGRRLARLAPRIALTAVAGEARRSGPAVLDHPELPSELQGKDFRPVLLSHGGDRVVLLPFSDDRAEPAAVIKIPKLPGFNGRTEHEQATLRALGSRLDPTLRRGVPQTLGMFRHGDVTVGVESYMPAPLIFRSRPRWGRRRERLRDLHLSAVWLADFHSQMLECRPAWGPAEQSRWVEAPLEHYGRAFGLTDLEERLFAETRAYGRSLDGTPLPIVLQHRDFTVWNIGRRGAQVQVLDWEGNRPGPALCDLLHFVTHWYETVHAAHDEVARQHCFRRLFFERDRRDRYGEAVDVAIERYLERLEMSPRFLPLLLTYTWVELALRRADQQQIQEEASEEPRAGNRYPAFVSILAEHADRLFRHPE